MDKVISGFDELIKELEAVGLRFSYVSYPENASDIHIASNSKVRIYCSNGDSFPVTEDTLGPKEVNDLFFKLCDYSVYRHLGELSKGYLTVFGKYRCGVAGTAVRRNGEVIAVRDISSMNIRVPRSVLGSSYKIADCKAKLLDGVLVAGPPSSGKTTVLRDMIRRLAGERCVIVDERRELSWSIPLPDVDIMFDFTKEEAISRAIRTLSPRVIVCDELAEDDIPVIKRAVSAGVSFVASIHADPNSWERRPAVRELIETGAFARLAVLNGGRIPGKLKEMIVLNELHEDHGSWWRSPVRNIHESSEILSASSEGVYA